MFHVVKRRAEECCKPHPGNLAQLDRNGSNHFMTDCILHSLTSATDSTLQSARLL